MHLHPIITKYVSRLMDSNSVPTIYITHNGFIIYVLVYNCKILTIICCCRVYRYVCWLLGSIKAQIGTRHMFFGCLMNLKETFGTSNLCYRDPSTTTPPGVFSCQINEIMWINNGMMIHPSQLENARTSHAKIFSVFLHIIFNSLSQ